MPELPEVETVRLFFQQHLLHKKIIKIKILTPKSFIGSKKLIINQKITSFSRHGKQLSINLFNHYLLLIHLKMTGQLAYQSNQQDSFLGHPTPQPKYKKLPNSSTRVIFTFSNQSKLFFNDQRKFGWIKVIKKSQIKQLQSNLGPDILSSDFSYPYFKKILQSSSRAIKNLLHDQSKLAGLGNIYVNDSLFLSKIHPLTPANKINLNKTKLLYNNIKKIIKQAIKKDAKQYRFRVYQKTGQTCPVCGTVIVRQKISGRSAFYCPSCQKLPKKKNNIQ
ncbi:DNA-formamidopyrimidine glycosylase [Candidatus Shapirobacteria bacterium]|nr:MAG: DNA-formamidopyrimidine glycosylase [Candidatus Shapirobacteria bacterium]